MIRYIQSSLECPFLPLPCCVPVAAVGAGGAGSSRFDDFVWFFWLWLEVMLVGFDASGMIAVYGLHIADLRGFRVRRIGLAVMSMTSRSGTARGSRTGAHSVSRIMGF